MKRGVLLGAVGVVLLGLLAAWMVGNGSAERPGPPPFSFSESQTRAGCEIGTYLPSEESGWEVEKQPPPRDWRRIEEAAGAMQADRSAVQVTIRPQDPGLDLTLTGVRVDVDHQVIRPLGIVFYRPCAQHLSSPAIEADLDEFGRITASSAAGVLRRGPRPAAGAPIDFPWTVDLRKPLRLYLIVHTEHCYCSWTAHISWESGSSEGVVHVNNGGRDYWITDTIGIRWDRPGSDGHWIKGSAPSWIGLE